MLLRACVAAAVVATGSGCGVDRTPTSDLSIAFEAKYDSGFEDLTADATLRDLSKNGLLYELGPDERLHVTFRGRSVERITPLESAPQADETITFTLERGGGDDVSVTGRFPPPITITSPASGKASEELLVTWSPTSTDAMRWRAYESCRLVSNDGPIREDVGSLAFPPNVFAGCSSPLDLLLFRQRRLTMDTRAATTTLTMEQVQHIDVRLEP
ncbi:MAG: hypothetical protein HOV81_09100 [Kofleriaceae bacterium]|nr:hypothetical protein [Kofleriaceae bacterium]